MRVFHRTFATGVACRQETLTPPDTWSRPIWDLHMFYLMGPIFFSNLSLFSGLCNSSIPRYFLDFAWLKYTRNWQPRRSATNILAKRTTTIEVKLLFNVTINDISVIYVTAHRCAGGLKKKLDLRSGSQRHRHFVGFFNVPVLAPTRDHPFYTVIPTHHKWRNKNPNLFNWAYLKNCRNKLRFPLVVLNLCWIGYNNYLVVMNNNVLYSIKLQKYMYTCISFRSTVPSNQ